MDPARRTRIFGLALPIIGGMVSQNLLNIVDTAMVGFLGRVLHVRCNHGYSLPSGMAASGSKLLSEADSEIQDILK